MRGSTTNQLFSRQPSLPSAAVWGCLLLFFLGANHSRAAQSRWVKLMRPDSLVAWDYGRQSPTGWTIHQGRLGGCKASSPLLSGFSFGEVELRFRFSVAQNGRWHVLLPEVPKGPGLEIVLCEGDGCGRVMDSGRELSPGKPLPRPQTPEPYWHTAAIQRAGEKLAVNVDGEQVAEVSIDPKRRFGLGLALSEGSGMLEDLRAREPLGEPLIGKDLSNWWTPGRMDKWRIEDGQIVRTERASNYLRTKRQYGNFTLSLQLLMKEGNNSGLGIRTPHDGWPSSDGIELQWLDRPGTAGTGANLALYGNVPPLDNVYRSGEWNDLVVKADGWIISAWQNGELVQHYNTLHHPELKHRNLHGWIGFQDHGGWIRVREAYVLEAPDGTGLEAWKRASRPLAGGLLIDRLMNPATLLRPDGLASGVATFECRTNEAPAGGSETDSPAAEERASSAGGKATENAQPTKPPGEQTVAELEGPGAVVRVSWQGEPGRLAFYFDGEAQPRIDAPPDQLQAHLPRFVENLPPLVSCIAFKKSLKITARQGRGGRLRIDYVRFPSDVLLPDDRDPAALFPRGWLVALGYHRHKYGLSARRKFEPYEHIVSKARRLGPGKQATLLRLKDAGVVSCLRLRAQDDPTKYEDLWLEVRCDGRKQPDVAAPVRFWFPGLVGAGSYQNFVLLRQDGVVNTLAIPFGRGLELRAVNRGGKPVEGLVAELVVERPQPEEKDELIHGPRLHGVFLPAGKQPEVLTRCQGAGRFVGLICEEPKGSAPGIDSLFVDGQGVSGWRSPDLNLFVGRSGEFRAALSGRFKGLAWRYLLLAPVDFQSSVELKAAGGPPGARLGLFYLEQP